jgi:hypothetical protein
MSKVVLTDKDLEIIKDRALSEWRQINGESALARAYFISVCMWLQSKDLMKSSNEIPMYKPRSLAIDNTPED